MLQEFTLFATIASAASLSGAAQPASAPNNSLGNMAVYGIIMPAAWTTANLTFQLAVDNSNYYNVYDANGGELTINADASRFILIPPSLYLAAGAIKVRSGTAATPVAQGAARTITLLARRFD